MTNTNCLKDMACPECSADGCFKVHCTWIGVVRLYDEGTEELSGGHTEITDTNRAECVMCNWHGTVAELYGKTPRIPRRR